jgi:hypothetical protein
MAKLNKAEKLKRYRHRVQYAQRWRSDAGYDDTWRRMVDLYKGKHFPSSFDDEDRIAINIAFSTINIIFPSITINHPKIEVYANKEEDGDRAIISQAVVNYWWKHYDFRTPFRRATKDFLIVGHGWIKTGYRYADVEKPKSADELNNDFNELADEADAYAQSNPEIANELPTDEEIEANLESTKVVVTEDRPFIERISPFDMFVDPEATCMDDATWIAQRIIRPIEDVKSDKRYNQTARRKVTADAVVRADWMSAEDRKKRDSDIDRVTVWEYYDLKSNTICVFTEGDGDYLVEPRPIPYAFGHPFEFIGNYEVPEEFYPTGDLEMIEAVQQELNKTRSQMMNHRKKYGRKYLYRAAALSPEGREGLESNFDNIAIEVVDDNMPLQDIIMPVPITPMSSDLYQYSDIVEQDMAQISGVNEYQRGASEMKRTATEAAMVQDAANTRSADKLAIIEVAIGRIASRVLALAQQFMTGEQVVRVVGSEAQQVWIPFSYEDIKGEFDFSVEGGSTQPQNETTRRQQAIAMMNSLGPMIGTVIDPTAIAKHVLQFGFGVKTPGKFLMQQPPPMAPGMPPQGGAPMSPEMSAPQPPQGQGIDAPQMDPRELLQMQQQAGGIDQLAQSGGGGIPPEILAQLQGQMGLQ